jgi:hypothetical protein
VYVRWTIVRGGRLFATAAKGINVIRPFHARATLGASTDTRPKGDD